jgi:hypothetical protein
MAQCTQKIKKSVYFTGEPICFECKRQKKKERRARKITMKDIVIIPDTDEETQTCMFCFQVLKKNTQRKTLCCRECRLKSFKSVKLHGTII